MPKLITILGPTACGKTRLAAQLCHHFNGEIISCDSRQFFRGMNIGSGKDYADLLVDDISIPIHLIDILNPSDEYDVFSYQKDFIQAFHKINSASKNAFLVGGSGLYLSAILQNYRFSKADFNSSRVDELNQLATEELVVHLKNISSQLHNSTDLIERERIIKAILIAESDNTAESAKISNFVSELTALVIGLNIDRALSKQIIAKRLSSRFEEGMIEEVQRLLAAGISPDRLKFFGLEYKFITSYLLSEITLDDMKEKLLFAIYNFAKRQMTWFRRMEKQGVKINWIDAPYYENARPLIENFIG